MNRTEADRSRYVAVMSTVPGSSAVTSAVYPPLFVTVATVGFEDTHSVAALTSREVPSL